MDFLSNPELISQASALGKVLMIDLVLAGDNAVAVGLAAAALPQEQRRKAILVGADHRSASGHRRPASGGRLPASVGVLEDVARTA